MKQLSSHNFKNVYQGLGINLSKLGCVMLDTEPIVLPNFIIQDPKSGSGCNWDALFGLETYKSKDPERFWIDGYVGHQPHVTLLYGLLHEAKNYEWHIEQLLEGWEMPTVTIESVGHFDSPYADEPYYCIVAHLEVTNKLLEGHQRLEFLPHINTFAGYKPHVTIGYIKKDDVYLNMFKEDLNHYLHGKELKIIGLNLGGNK